MNSMIFAAVTRLLFVLMFCVSLYVFYRGHNEPGGGFIGGLIAACGFAVLALSRGIDAARAALRIHPLVLVGIGVCCTVASGLFGLFVDGSFLTHQWTALAGVELSTTLLFDGGVYLVVLGAILSLVLRFYEGL